MTDTSISVDDYGADATGGADSTFAISAAAAAAKAANVFVVEFGAGSYRIDAGNIVLDGVALRGNGVPNLYPTSGAYNKGNTTLLLTGTANPPFLLGTGWDIQGISFWWPNQVGPTVNAAVPPLFSSAGQDKSTRGSLRHCTIFNAYRVFDIAADGLFGDVLISENRIFAIKSLLRLKGSMPEYVRTVDNFFSFGIIHDLAYGTGTALRDAYAASAELIDCDCGSSTRGTTMDGLFFENNFVFGANKILAVKSGGLNVSRVANNKFDGVPTVFSWSSSGICNGSAVNDNTIYSYQFGNPAVNRTVFETSVGNADSDYTFSGNKITYAQGRPFFLGGSYASHRVNDNEMTNWGMTTTPGNYAALTNAPGGRNSFSGNWLNSKSAPPSGAVRFGIQVNGDVQATGNNFANVNFPIVVNGGVLRVAGNSSTGSPTKDVTVVAGSVVGNALNAWSNP